MTPRYRIDRPQQSFDMMQIEQMRKTIERSRDLLRRTPRPDIFLGRTTYPPFPANDVVHQISVENEQEIVRDN